MEYAKRAKELFLNGYNCAQAVAAAFSEAYDIDPALAARMTAALGGGLARQREVCGAVLGMGVVLGLAAGEYVPGDHEAKKCLYQRTQQLSAKFREENGSIICRELLGGVPQGGEPSERTESYYKKRPCAELVAFAAELLEEELFGRVER